MNLLGILNLIKAASKPFTCYVFLNTKKMNQNATYNVVNKKLKNAKCIKMRQVILLHCEVNWLTRQPGRLWDLS